MTTRRLPFFIVLTAVLAPVWAQTSVAPPPNVEAEKTRIAAERKAVEERYGTERAGCYQKFAVESCLSDTRRRRRAQVEDLNRQSAIINDAERKRRAAAELDRLEQQKSPPAAQAESGRGPQGQQEREQRAAEHASDSQAKEAQAAANRRAYEQKQGAHAQEEAQREQRRAQEQVEREQYDAKQKEAERQRAELDERNAKRTKPRGAPLPPPPP